MAVIRATFTTIGQSSPASVGNGKYYRYNGDQPAKKEPLSDPLPQNARATSAKQKRMAEFTRLRLEGRTKEEAGADLHARIAAKSPEHAALVAAFEALPGLPPAWDPAEEASAKRTAWLERAEQYAAFRPDLTQEAAARHLRVCVRTAQNYEAALRTGGVP